jgi:hypothetical protein
MSGAGFANVMVRGVPLAGLDSVRALARQLAFLDSRANLLRCTLMITNELMRTPPDVTVAEFLRGIPPVIGKIYTHRTPVEFT